MTEKLIQHFYRKEEKLLLYPYLYMDLLIAFVIAHN